MAERWKTKKEYDEDEYSFNVEKARTREAPPVLRLRSSTTIPPQTPASPSLYNPRHTNTRTPAVAASSVMDQNVSRRITRNASQQQQDRQAGDKSTGASNSQVCENPKQEPFNQVMSSEQAFFEMQEAIEQVRLVLVLNPETIRKLLIQFNWDQDRLVEAYFEDKEKMFQDTNIAPLAVSSGLYDSLDTGMWIECPICYENVRGEEMASMLCGHNYCTNCWNRYLVSNVDSCLDQDLVCPQPGCRIILEEPGVRRALASMVGSQKMQRYYRLMAQSFVECHPKYRWCNSMLTDENRCNKALRINNTHHYWDEIECVCGHICCTDCTDDGHFPIKCGLLTTWRNKCVTILKNNPGWIVNPVSRCRFCKAPNLKSHSNFTKCQKRNCAKRYWILWEHPTNEKNDTEGESDPDPEDFACYHPKKGLPAYQKTMREKFYFYRFIQHEDSLRREKNYKLDALRMADQMRKSGNWLPAQANTIIKATRTLAKSRQIVMYSYVFAFYAVKTDDLDLFVEFQGILEADVETLSNIISRFLKRTLTEVTAKWVESLISRCNLIQDNRAKILELVNQGTWKFTN